MEKNHAKSLSPMFKVIKGATEPVEVVVQLTEGAAITGTVIDNLGAPVAGATVTSDMNQGLAAGTGCFVVTGLMPLLPLCEAGLIDLDDIVIDAKTGITGAGRSAAEWKLFSEVTEGTKAYGIATHRHTAEFDQELSKAAGRDVVVSFTPHLLPMNRGILATIYVKGDPEAIQAALAARYAAEPFVQVMPMGEAPTTWSVRGSNMVRIGVTPDRRPGRAIIVSVLDNLVKGASGQAVQCANLMLGFEETEGLMLAPMFP